MAAKKKRRVPHVLWRLFGNRARTLADTILALIPPSPRREDACDCGGKLCLGCCGDESMSFLLRPEDPLDYRKLLTRGFVVVSEVPHPPPDFDLRRLCSHREMVRRIIELMLYNKTATSNLICSNYDRRNRLSFAVDELTSSKWKLLLSRVGDDLMIYLLKHTSIFLPLPREKHLQISGYPVTNLLARFSVPMPRYGVKQKRKRVDGDELPRKQPRVNSEDYEPLSTSFDFPTGNGSNANNVHKKRKRVFGWERHRTRMQLAGQRMPCTSQSDLGNTPNCLCCSVFKKEPRMKRNGEIDKRNIFYKMENCSLVLPKTRILHILYTLKANCSGASLLFNNIFEANGPEENTKSIPCCHKENGCRFTCLYHGPMQLLKILLHNIRNCNHKNLLEKHCPTRFSSQDASTGAGNASEVPMTKNQTTVPESSTAPVESSITYCLKSQVVSFIWAICRRIVPQPLLGEPSSWRSLRRNISKFVELRRYEKFSMKECLYKLKISKFPIFSMQTRYRLGVTESDRRAMFESWIFWFFAHLVSPLVESCFYVTDSQHKRHEVLFYKKSDWKTLMKQDKHVPPERYCRLNYEQARGLLHGRSFGFSRARLHPKNKGGFRMLANFQAPSRFLGPNRCSKSVNRVLNEVHLVLRGSQANEPEKLGASVFGYNDVYKKFVPFLLKLKNGLCNLPALFLMVSDVSNAFDSIKHEKLLSVMKDVMLSDEFTLQKLTQVVCFKKSLRVDQQPMLPHEDIVVAASKRVRSRYRDQTLGGIAVKKVLSKKIRKGEIHSLLKEHITGNMVEFGEKLYLQKEGIPQGSVLSTLLCSFYYGHMERNLIFPFLEESKEDLLATSASQPGCEYLLLRFLDDFLFISTSKQQASKLFNKLEGGVGDYNCTMNKEKFGINFTMEDRQLCQSHKLHIGRDNTSFLQWSGLLINCSTLEIQADYTRYLNCHLSSTLTVKREGNVGRILRDKLKSYLRPKCHPLFYDSNINSPGVVRLNIYQAFMLSAMKFFCHLSNLSILPRFTPKFCFNAIMASLSYMNRLIKRRMLSFRVDSGFRPKYDVRKEDVIWLGLRAYIRVLKKKQSRYKILLCMLRSLLRNYYGEVENMSPELRYATHDLHSYVLLAIKF